MRTNHSVFHCRPSLRAVFGCFILGTIAVSFGFSFPNEFPVDEGNTDHRSIGEYRQDVKTFMKHSKSDDAQLQRNAIFNLCELHWELVNDPRFGTNSQVQGFRVVVAKRLETFVKEVKKENLRAQRLAKKKLADPSSSKSTQDGKLDPNASADNNGLASSNATNSDDAEEMIYQSSADSFYSLGQLSGGPNQLFGYAGGHLGPPWDHGPELVDLIQNTINPDFWRANGGNGVIHYFRPLRVLVIGASTQIHEDTLDLLYKLRAAGQ